MSAIPSGTEGYELELKRHALIQKDWELYNAYITDTRLRTDGIIKAVILISGGALTLSAGVFLRLDRPKILPELIPVLQNSWAAFGAAILFSILLTVWMIISADVHGRRWETSLRTSSALAQPGRIYGIVAWALGVLAILACITGLCSLVYVARAMLTLPV